MDPDQTVDYSGSYTTDQKVENTFAAGDSLTSVSATGRNTTTYFAATTHGDNAPKITYFSSDSSSKATYGTSGLSYSGGIYGSEAYDSVKAKDSTYTRDAWIGITTDKGTLTAGSTAEFVYFTSLDDVNTGATIVSDIATAVAEAEAAAAAGDFPHGSHTAAAEACRSVHRRQPAGQAHSRGCFQPARARDCGHDGGPCYTH